MRIRKFFNYILANIYISIKNAKICKRIYAKTMKAISYSLPWVKWKSNFSSPVSSESNSTESSKYVLEKVAFLFQVEFVFSSS